MPLVRLKHTYTCILHNILYMLIHTHTRTHNHGMRSNSLSLCEEEKKKRYACTYMHPPYARMWYIVSKGTIREIVRPSGINPMENMR